jgi:hypothetical protein
LALAPTSTRFSALTVTLTLTLTLTVTLTLAPASKPRRGQAWQR